MDATFIYALTFEMQDGSKRYDFSSPTKCDLTTVQQQWASALEKAKKSPHLHPSLQGVGKVLVEKSEQFQNA